MKRLHCVVLAVLLLCMTLFCGAAAPEKGEDIVILYTSDVHCGVEDDIGYAGLAAYKAAMEAKTEYVSLVDCGDALQGAFIGTISQGEYMVEIMNELGYDLAVPGNHEFDYGMEQLSALLAKAEAQYLACNIDFSGRGPNALETALPYVLEEYGDVTVGFIGVATPESLIKSTPSYFMEDGDYVYSFCAGEDGARLWERVQSCADACRAVGADYVIVLSHLGDLEESAPYTSVELIRNTWGIDAVLDGHAHSEIPCRVEENARGGEVLLGACGTKLENIGQLVIRPGGVMSLGLISDYGRKDADFEAFYAGLAAGFEQDMNRVVARSDTALSADSPEGTRLVRCRETALGNFCADAYRWASGAQIAMVNGGGIRADLPAGDILYADVLALHPYGNSLCVAEVTGQEILDALEMASRDTCPAYEENGQALGENGGFLQVSGLRYTIDTTVSSSVELDENGMFAGVTGPCRVTEVEVMNEAGDYELLEPEALYTLASHNYLIREGGDGLGMFRDNELIVAEGVTDHQILLDYITEGLDGQLAALYGKVEGRIEVK